MLVSSFADDQARGAAEIDWRCGVGTWGGGDVGTWGRHLALLF